MKELLEYRQKLLEKLLSTVEEFRQASLAVQDPSQPLEAAGWTAHQLAVHVRDVDKLVYGRRARRTAQEEKPRFESFDADAHMTQHYDSSESLTDILDELDKSIQDLVAFLRSLPNEDWARQSWHSTLGSDLTLQSWVERSLAHLQEHLQTLKNFS